MCRRWIVAHLSRMTRSVVAVKKEEQTGLMHDQQPGKGQRHAHKTSQTLAQGVVPSLHVGRFSRLFARRCVLLLWDHRVVCKGGS
jgi:hypothetical protein